MKPALQTRATALGILKDVLDNKITITLAFAKCKNLKEMVPADEKFVRLLVLTTLRRYGQSKKILSQYVKKKFSGKKKEVERILILAIVQLYFLKTPPHAVVDTSVELTKILRLKFFSGFVNGVLHAVCNKINDVLQDELENLPVWLKESWISCYGEEKTRSFVKYFNSEPFLDISVKENPEEWAKKLNGIVINQKTVRCHFTENIPSLEGYAEGAWWVQEASAAMPAELFSCINEKKGADLCSAPGGKTAQLVMRGGFVDAYDISLNRLERLKENIERLKLKNKVQVICSDALEIEGQEKYDFVLLDAPCSATGTMKRHPDLMYLREKEDVLRLAKLQKELLQKAVTLLKKEGELVYSTCSLQEEENEALIQSFLKEHNEMERVTLKNKILAPFFNEFGAIQVLPGVNGNQDGFYAVLLKKK
ncbi:MAG: RsmB/NOP family class I SAM-dependent RNA methyltransferase [Alphaproteobacteria bacterium]|nr:RsmB/NOP family class I SAM-dependent RNA methyltransferase [Alphaproteobacteria bacterium]